jgi:hypothetical protein
MGKRDEALVLLRDGWDPMAIASRQKVGLATIIGYLNKMIGAGKLRRLDVLFSLPRERRLQMKTREDRQLVETFGSAAHALGDMYEALRRAEITLHAGIRRALQEQYGESEAGWWRFGVPLSVRQKLQIRREEDSDPAEPYAYTDLLDLAEILDKNWTTIAPKVIHDSSQKKVILSNLRRLNIIRRKVMHPVRYTPPADDEFEDEFKFVCGFSKTIVQQA